MSSIKTNIASTHSDVMQTSQGTLVLNPQYFAPTFQLFNQKDIKAIWIDENYLMFKKIRANQYEYILSEPKKINALGYTIQPGEKKILFRSTHPSITHNAFAQRIIQYWFNYTTSFNDTIHSLYHSLGIKHQEEKQPTLSEIRVKSKKRAPTNPEINKTSSQIAKLIKLYYKQKLLTHNILLNYLYIFLSIFIVMLITTLSGILISSNQNILGVLALMFLTSLYISHYSYILYTVTLQIKALLPSYSLFTIYTLIIMGLCFCCIVALLIRNKLEIRRYG